MKLIVDRIEENFVVCENYESGEILNLDISLFPKGIKSSDLLELNDGVLTLLNNNEINKRISKKMNQLWK